MVTQQDIILVDMLVQFTSLTECAKGTIKSSELHNTVYTRLL